MSDTEHTIASSAADSVFDDHQILQQNIAAAAGAMPDMVVSQFLPFDIETSLKSGESMEVSMGKINKTKKNIVKTATQAALGAKKKSNVANRDSKTKSNQSLLTKIGGSNEQITKLPQKGKN